MHAYLVLKVGMTRANITKMNSSPEENVQRMTSYTEFVIYIGLFKIIILASGITVNTSLQ